MDLSIVNKKGANLEFLIGSSMALRAFSFIKTTVKEKQINNGLRTHGYSKNDISMVGASIEYFTSSEKDRNKIYKKVYHDLFKISQDNVENLLELCLIGAFQYEDVGKVILGNLNKALEAKEGARLFLSKLGLPFGKPITMHYILMIASGLRKK